MITFKPVPGATAGPVYPTELPGAAEIAVIIPHLNDATRLERCLQALTAQSFDMSRAEIVVVDNGSDNPPDALVAGFPNTRLIRETIPGPGPARNLGVSETRAPILAFIDSDCIPDPSWIAAILRLFSGDREIDVLGGDIQVTVASPGHPTGAEAFELLYGFRQSMQIRRHSFSATANLAVRRRIFEEVGPFGGIDISEDLDWGQRAAAMGHRTVFAKDAVVRHPARHDMRALHWQWSRHVRHFYRHAHGRPLGRLRWLLTIPAVALSPLAEIPLVFSSGKLSGAGQRWRAFQALVNVRLYRAGQMLEALTSGDRGAQPAHWNRTGPEPDEGRRPPPPVSVQAHHRP